MTTDRDATVMHLACSDQSKAELIDQGMKYIDTDEKRHFLREVVEAESIKFIEQKELFFAILLTLGHITLTQALLQRKLDGEGEDFQ